MLPSALRLRRNRDFQAVYRVRKSWATPSLVLYIRFHARPPSGDTSSVRLGFVISKKVAKRAHERNLLKRRLREICRRELIPQKTSGRSWDALFVARSLAPTLDFPQLTAEVEMLSRRAGLL